MSTTREVKFTAKHSTENLERVTDWILENKPIHQIYPVSSGRFLVTEYKFIHICDPIKKTTRTLPVDSRISNLLVIPKEDMVVYTHQDQRRIYCLKINLSEPPISFPLSDNDRPGQPILMEENIVVLPTTKELKFFSIKPFTEQFSIPLSRKHYSIQDCMIGMPNGRLLRSIQHTFNPANIVEDHLPSFIKNEKTIFELFEIREEKEVVLARGQSKKLYFTQLINYSPYSFISLHEEEDRSVIRTWKIKNSTIKKDFTFSINNSLLKKIILLPDNQTVVGIGKDKNVKQFFIINIVTKIVDTHVLSSNIYDLALEPNGLVGFATDTGFAVIPFEMLLNNNYLNSVSDELQLHFAATGASDIILSYLASHPFALYRLKKVPIALAEESKRAIIESIPGKIYEEPPASLSFVTTVSPGESKLSLDPYFQLKKAATVKDELGQLLENYVSLIDSLKDKKQFHKAESICNAVMHIINGLTDRTLIFKGLVKSYQNPDLRLWKALCQVRSDHIGLHSPVEFNAHDDAWEFIHNAIARIKEHRVVSTQSMTF